MVFKSVAPEAASVTWPKYVACFLTGESIKALSALTVALASSGSSYSYIVVEITSLPLRL